MMMDSNKFLKLIDSTEEIEMGAVGELEEILEKYPYFQAARALYLKGLKKQGSYLYNNELKKAAAYTTDRSILFDYITSEGFISKSELILEPEEKNISEKVDSEISEEILDLGKPLDFEKNDYLSFSEWLQVRSMKKINRSIISEIPKNITEKLGIIDRFIAVNPKIKTVKSSGEKEDVTAESAKIKDHIMTETLAKVYLEQKKYDSAIKAYRILSLKYPEKSVLFANQIKAIRVLQNKKL